MPKIIINADDYGISSRFDDAMLDLIKKGYLQSLSVVVRDNISQKSVEKLMKISGNKNVSIGLHFEYSQNNTDDDKYEKIYNEIKSQYQKFFEIFGINACHIDKHNREKSENEAIAMCNFSIEKNIPVRLYTRGKYFYVYENIYRGKIKITDRLYNLGSNKYGIEKIKEDLNNPDYANETREVVCHPGFFDKNYDSIVNGSEMNEVREEEYNKVIEIGKYLKEKKIDIISFYEL